MQRQINLVINYSFIFVRVDVFPFFDCSSPFYLVNWILLYFHFRLLNWTNILCLLLQELEYIGQSNSFPGSFLVLFSSPMGSVTRYDSSLANFCYSGMLLHFAVIHLFSDYYNYQYMITGVLWLWSYQDRIKIVLPSLNSSGRDRWCKSIRFAKSCQKSSEH